jgi:hypothetical protein
VLTVRVRRRSKRGRGKAQLLQDSGTKAEHTV